MGMGPADWRNRGKRAATCTMPDWKNAALNIHSRGVVILVG